MTTLQEIASKNKLLLLICLALLSVNLICLWQSFILSGEYQQKLIDSYTSTDETMEVPFEFLHDSYYDVKFSIGVYKTISGRGSTSITVSLLIKDQENELLMNGTLDAQESRSSDDNDYQPWTIRASNTYTWHSPKFNNSTQVNISISPTTLNGQIDYLTISIYENPPRDVSLRRDELNGIFWTALSVLIAVVTLTLARRKLVEYKLSIMTVSKPTDEEPVSLPDFCRLLFPEWYFQSRKRSIYSHAVIPVVVLAAIITIATYLFKPPALVFYTGVQFNEIEDKVSEVITYSIPLNPLNTIFIYSSLTGLIILMIVLYSLAMRNIPFNDSAMEQLDLFYGSDIEENSTLDVLYGNTRKNFFYGLAASLIYSVLVISILKACYYTFLFDPVSNLFDQALFSVNMLIGSILLGLLLLNFLLNVVVSGLRGGLSTIALVMLTLFGGGSANQAKALPLRNMVMFDFSRISNHVNVILGFDFYLTLHVLIGMVCAVYFKSLIEDERKKKQKKNSKVSSKESTKKPRKTKKKKTSMSKLVEKTPALLEYNDTYLILVMGAVGLISGMLITTLLNNSNIPFFFAVLFYFYTKFTELLLSIIAIDLIAFTIDLFVLGFILALLLQVTNNRVTRFIYRFITNRGSFFINIYFFLIGAVNGALLGLNSTNGILLGFLIIYSSLATYMTYRRYEMIRMPMTTEEWRSYTLLNVLSALKDGEQFKYSIPIEEFTYQKEKELLDEHGYKSIWEVDEVFHRKYHTEK